MFQLDWVNAAGTRYSRRHESEETARHDYEILESGRCPDGHTPPDVQVSEPVQWVALTVDRPTPKGYRVLSSRGGPNEPAFYREGANA